MSGAWRTEVLREGIAGWAAARPADERSVVVLDVARPTLVLGSSQADGTVDHERAARRGVDIVRRRSGGAAVLVEPGAAVWIDVTIPAGDPLWDNDVGRAFHWLGAAWAEVLAAEGLPARMHDGPLRSTPWSGRVCFAGLGPGEVTVDGRKVVGLSQRRTREAARFQCCALRRWEPGADARPAGARRCRPPRRCGGTARRRRRRRRRAGPGGVVGRRRHRPLTRRR